MLASRAAELGISAEEVEARDFVQMFLDQQAEQPRRKTQLAITFKNDEAVVGSCGIRRKPENDWEADIGFEVATVLARTRHAFRFG